MPISKVKGFLRKGKYVNSFDRKSKDAKKKEQIQKLRTIVPYQDKDLSSIRSAISGASAGAGLAGAGSLYLANKKITKKLVGNIKGKTAEEIKDLLSKSKLLKKIALNPELIRRYGSKVLERSGKVAIAGAILGGGLGILAGRKSADKINKKLGRENIKETNKERRNKILKGLGVAALGIGIGTGAGKLYSNRTIGKLFNSESFQQQLDNKLSGIRQATQANAFGKLKNAQSKLKEELRDELRNRKDIKLLGEGELKDDQITDVIKSRLKDKGRKMGETIAMRQRQNNEAINKIPDFVRNRIDRYAIKTGGVLGGTLGVGLYANNRYKNTLDKKKKK